VIYGVSKDVQRAARHSVLPRFNVPGHSLACDGRPAPRVRFDGSQYRRVFACACGANLMTPGNLKFYVGLHHPADSRHFDLSCISVNALRGRKRDINPREWILDSGAFTEISTHGCYRTGVADYAAQIRRWRSCGQLVAAVSQDWMCEPHIIQKTGLSVAQHQRLTIERYDALIDCDVPAYVLPVLQGFRPDDYRAHLAAYGDRLVSSAWVGVGSVCKRNGSPEQILSILTAIKAERPDLRLHGFGVKHTSLCHPGIRSMLYSADSMAWSFAARVEGRNGNDWREAAKFAARIEAVSARPASLYQSVLGL